MSGARLANGKADAQPVLVKLHEDVADRGQPLAGRLQAGRVQILPERVGHDAHRLHRVSPLLAGSCQPVALALGLGQHRRPCLCIGRQGGEGGDGADAAEK